jgi:hypothetical protein
VKRASGHNRVQCTACRHVERTRLDWLIASGSQLKPLAQRFGLSPNAIYNHARKHITPEFRAAVRVGPFSSEEELRRLCAENGASVVEQLRAVNGAVSARWLIAFEAGADATFADLTSQLRKNLELMAKLTKELAPVPSVVTTNNFVLFQSPEYIAAVTGIADALRPFPEARRAVTAALRRLGAASERPLLEVHPASDEAA